LAGQDTDTLIPVAVILALLTSMLFLFRVLPWRKPGSWRWIWVLATVAALMIMLAEAVALLAQPEAVDTQVQVPIFVAVLAAAAGFFVVYTDALRSAESSRILSLTDALTALPNARAFRERLRLAFDARKKQPFSVMYADLDGFKKVNDGFGHEAGDSLLKEVAAILGRAVREHDMVARLGGDEFGFLLSSTDPGAARIVADRVLEGFKGLDLPGDLRVGISFGAASSSTEAGNPSELLAVADEAMYTAKRLGGSRVIGAQEMPA